MKSRFRIRKATGVDFRNVLRLCRTLCHNRNGNEPGRHKVCFDNIDGGFYNFRRGNLKKSYLKMERLRGTIRQKEALQAEIK